MFKLNTAMILAGHGHYLAARQLALAQVPVVVVSGLSAAKKRAPALADNKIAANAGGDRGQLAAELGELAPLPRCSAGARPQAAKYS